MTKNSLQRGVSLLIIIIIVLLLAGAGIDYFYTRQNQETTGEKMMGEHKEDSMVGKEEIVVEKKENGAMMEKYAGQVIAGTSSPLLDFNKADYDKALASDKLVVLYFYANWCPICKEEVSNALYPAFNELSGDGVVGFRINYNDNQTDDDEKNLAREFGVAYQHTKVFLKNGQRVLKSPESWNKSRYLEEINKSL